MGCAGTPNFYYKDSTLRTAEKEVTSQRSPCKNWMCALKNQLVSSNSSSHYLDQLDQLKSRFGRGEHRKIERALTRVSGQKIGDVEAVIRYHEILLFLAAYPANSRILRTVNTELSKFSGRIERLEAIGEDLSQLEHPEFSGIAGMSVTDTFSYYIVRWLLKRASGPVRLDWNWFEDENRLGETWPRFMPLLEEDTLVEANIPFRKWLQAVTGGTNRELPWLISRFEKLPRADKERAELYNSLQLYVTWTPSYRQSRTGLRLPARQVFYHRDALIQRREVSLDHELASRPPDLKLLAAKQGESSLDLARAASTVRYRELYGFTHGETRKVFRVNLGRGVEVLVSGLPPGVRLPLRAYHAAMIFKNGVPVGYFEGLSIFERMESGFNLYYTFRDGETAWLYAKLLNIFRHLLGVTAFSIDPYQIGFENEEGIESGAFWFYRKLGFRPTRREIMKLVVSEENKIATRKDYRTPARTLRKLAAGPMIFELDKTREGDWDRFEARNIGIAVQRRIARSYQGDVDEFRKSANARLGSALGTIGAGNAQTSAFSDFAAALSAENVGSWGAAEKRSLARIIHAKATRDESRYLNLMQKHTLLRSKIIKLGSD